jgi:aspartyl-tRNA(Asn)/glutamyl-tRNA(Gln) amidotransferase subunit C
MELSDKEVSHVARLARLKLTDEEKERFRSQLAKILTYMEELKRIDTKDVPPTAHALGLTGAFREDEARLFPQVSEILKLAPQREESYFKVPKIIE